jgi:hypothetical protein
MKRSLCFIFLVLTLPVLPQQWHWATSANSTTGGQVGERICCDNAGNVFVLGVNKSKATYGSTPLDSGSFILKYTTNGNLDWVKKIPGTPNDIQCDPAGNIYLCGKFTGNITLSPYNFTSFGGSDIFLEKFSSSGNLLWAKQYGGNGDDNAASLALDNSSNCYLTGSYQNSISFGNKNLSDSTGTGSTIFYITKLDAAGNVQWATSGPQNYQVNGNLYYFKGTCIKVTKAQEVNVMGVGNNLYSPYPIMFFLKYNPSGGLVMHKKPWNCFSHDNFALDDSANVFHIYNSSTHYFYSPVLAKYDPQTNQKWTRSASDGAYYPNYLLDRGLCSNDSGHVFLSGSVGGPYMTGNTVTVCTTPMIRRGGADIMVGKYDKSGNCKWFKTAGGINDETATAMCTDVNGNCYVMGLYNRLGASAYSDTVTFDNIKLSNHGNWEQLFVAKLGMNPLILEVPLVLSMDVKFRLYPNPTAGLFTLQLSELKEAKILVCDALGRCIFTKDCRNESQSQINLSGQPKGIYFVQVSSGEERSVQKLLIE